jgi:periplasmic protein TonB
MSAQADIFTEREGWRRPLSWSLALHLCLLAGILLYGLVGTFGGQSWGSGGSGSGAMNVELVSRAAIPLPANEQGKSIVAHESPGLSKSLPREEEKAPEAIPIPEKNAKRKPPKPERSTVAKNQPPEPEPENVVPFGQGGPISGPYGVFNAGAAKGGLSFGGGGDFGSRFGWYVDVVRRKISENWMKYEVDPGVSSGQRVYITFDILKNGQPTNVQVEQSSGVPSLDVSATRAIQRIDSFGPLPNEYSGNKVSVEFWFDYRR